jgi:hypothetical protein
MALTVPARTDPRSRRRRLSGPVLVAGAVLAASVLLHVRDPHRSGSWGVCPWLLLTGSYCPGCGGLRAVNDLTHGDVAGAASSNLLLVTALPFVLTAWGRWLLDSWHGTVRRVSGGRVTATAAVLAAAVLAFWVLRNLEAGAWLAP